MIKIGDHVPETCFYILEPNKDDVTKVTYDDIFKGSKVVLFGTPGAFTSVCSSKHLPDFAKRVDELNELGADKVVCMAVNDAYVLREWAIQSKIDPKKILLISDGDCEFAKQAGLSQHLPGHGNRCVRFSMYVEDGIVTLLNVEAPGAKSYKVSGPETLIQQLKSHKPLNPVHEE